jgi:hypothetical protein
MMITARFAISLLFGVLCVARDLWLLAAFGFNSQPDTHTYVAINVIRALPYSLTNQALNTAAQPEPVILLQILLAAFAVGTLVYVVWRESRLFALIVGILLTLDINWAVMNLNLLTESMSMSFSVMALALFTNQFRRRNLLRWWELVSAGVVYTWAFTIRPSSVGMLLPVVIGYLIMTRSVRRTLLLYTGIALMLGATLLLTHLYAGKAHILGSSGTFTASALFTYRIFDPANGTASAGLDAALMSCDPDMDYSAINILNGDDYLYRQILPCLDSFGWTQDEKSSTFNQSYIEAILAHPQDFARILFEQTTRMFIFPLQDYALLSLANGQNVCEQFAWCDASNARALQNPALRESTLRLADSIVRMVSQVTPIQSSSWMQQLSNQPVIYQGAEGFVPSALWTAILWAVVLLFALVNLPNVLRALFLATLISIVYLHLSVIVGHGFAFRYVVPLSPLYAIVTAAVVTSAVMAVKRAFSQFSTNRWPLARLTAGICAFIVLLVSAGLIGTIAASATTADWINTHIADGSQIVYERAAQVTIDTAILAPDARELYIRGESFAASEDIPRWISEGRNYLLVDSRTPMQSPTFERRLQTLEAEAPVTLAFTNRSLWTMLGLGPEQAIYWLFEPQTPLDAVFDGGLRLIGYDVEPQPDGSVEILFYWYTQTPTPVSYNYFIHVLDPATGEILGQADRQVGDYTHQTGIWRPGELVFDRVRVPAPEDGTIEQIAFGLYDLASGTRAAAASLDGTPLGDRFVIAVE